MYNYEDKYKSNPLDCNFVLTRRFLSFILPPSSGLMQLCSSETLVSKYQSTGRYDPQKSIPASSPL